MKARFIVSLFASLSALAALAGCSAVQQNPIGANHPANPSAPQVPIIASASLIDDGAAGDFAPAHLEASELSQFVCPMHADVRQAGPGECPKCNMALVAVAAATDEDEGDAGHDH